MCFIYFLFYFNKKLGTVHLTWRVRVWVCVWGSVSKWWRWGEMSPTWSTKYFEKAIYAQKKIVSLLLVSEKNFSVRREVKHVSISLICLYAINILKLIQNYMIANIGHFAHESATVQKPGERATSHSRTVDRSLAHFVALPSVLYWAS